MYNQNGHFAELVQKITALALIPINKIDEAWFILKNSFNFFDKNVIDLLNYIETSWISNTRPLFDRSIWSHYGTLRGRTNNAAEGFHSKLNKINNKTNTSFSEVLSTLKEIQISSEIELKRLIWW